MWVLVFGAALSGVSGENHAVRDVALLFPVSVPLAAIATRTYPKKAV